MASRQAEAVEQLDELEQHAGRVGHPHPAAAPHVGPGQLVVGVAAAGAQPREPGLGLLGAGPPIRRVVVGVEGPVDVRHHGGHPVRVEQATHQQGPVVDDAAAQRLGRQLVGPDLGQARHAGEAIGELGRPFVAPTGQVSSPKAQSRSCTNRVSMRPSCRSRLATWRASIASSTRPSATTDSAAARAASAPAASAACCRGGDDMVFLGGREGSVGDGSRLSATRSQAPSGATRQTG